MTLGIEAAQVATPDPVSGGALAIESMVLRRRARVEDLPEAMRGGGEAAPAGRGSHELAGCSLAEVERDLIAANLELMAGNREKTARVLGIGERTLYRKIKECGL
jgi:two-component system, NtrC family, response regulator HydG